MKWGVRRSDPSGVSRSTNREARKDAIVVGGALYAHKTGIDKTTLNAGKKAYAKAKDPNGRQTARNLLRDIGIG